MRIDDTTSFNLPKMTSITIIVYFWTIFKLDPTLTTWDTCHPKTHIKVGTFKQSTCTLGFMASKMIIICIPDKKEEKENESIKKCLLIISWIIIHVWIRDEITRIMVSPQFGKFTAHTNINMQNVVNFPS
jgi:hypothetical protein